MKIHGKFLLAAGVCLILILPAVAPRADLVPKGPDAFDGTGVLHDIRADGVVINDIYLRLAPDVEFKSPDAKDFAPPTFRRGDTVGYIKDAQGRVAVLWLLRLKS